MIPPAIECGFGVLGKHGSLINKEYGDWAPRPGSLAQVMERIKPATFLLEPGEYKDKLPPLHTVELRCDMDMTDYNTLKKEFVLEFPDARVVAVNAAVVTQKLQQLRNPDIDLMTS